MEMDTAERSDVKKFYMKHYVSEHVERSLEIIRSRFNEIMDDQHAFESPKCLEIMLKIIGNRHQ